MAGPLAHPQIKTLKTCIKINELNSARAAFLDDFDTFVNEKLGEFERLSKEVDNRVHDQVRPSCNAPYGHR